MDQSLFFQITVLESVLKRVTGDMFFSIQAPSTATTWPFIISLLPRRWMLIICRAPLHSSRIAISATGIGELSRRPNVGPM